LFAYSILSEDIKFYEGIFLADFIPDIDYLALITLAELILPLEKVSLYYEFIAV